MNLDIYRGFPGNLATPTAALSQSARPCDFRPRLRHDDVITGYRQDSGIWSNMATARWRHGRNVCEKDVETTTHDDSSESDGETEPAKAFHRRISTNKSIKTKVGVVICAVWREMSGFVCGWCYMWLYSAACGGLAGTAAGLYCRPTPLPPRHSPCVYKHTSCRNHATQTLTQCRHTVADGVPTLHQGWVWSRICECSLLRDYW